MTDDNAGNGATEAGEAGGAGTDGGAAPGITFEIGHQYIKDLSFEVPGAPGVFENKAAPEVKVNVDVGAKALDGDSYEVTLTLEARGQSGSVSLFIVELAYAGLFRVADVPQEHLQPLLLIEAPRLLFPFARNVVAGVTRDGGLPPLMISPIDFVAMYRNRAAAQQRQAGATSDSETAG